MLTRRNLLLSALGAPLLASQPLYNHSTNQGIEFLIESHFLAVESAQGFQRVAAECKNPHSHLIVLPAARNLSWETVNNLRRKVESGSWLLWESGLGYSPEGEVKSQRLILSELFGIQVASGAIPGENSGCRYVAYSWPSVALVRTFGTPLTVSSCAAEECIATGAEGSIACRQRFGEGGIIFLGSVLGTNLIAGDREAVAIASQIFTRFAEPLFS
jgi:hypothetical protein